MYNTDLPNRAELPSSKQLLRSTLIAIIAAAVLLVTVVLPSEYGIDPTRVGRVLGLTQMGEIKMTLAAEAARDRENDAARNNAGQTAVVPPTQNTAASQPKTTENNAALKTDEMTVTLKPGQGIEIKLEMSKGARVNYEWTTSGGALNYDTHGDNASKAFISYKKGTGVEKDSGELIADFDGSHGWFWRNRTTGDVTVTIKTSGEYQNIKKMG
ncbi:MAG: transmembrane anchor protein [Acidobacteriota bacterium]|nr:transmembrane anchor protein [Acidobacteriota bacterium]